MGNVVNFRRKPDLVPPEVAGNPRSASSGNSDVSLGSGMGLPAHVHAEMSAVRSPSAVCKRIGVTQSARGTSAVEPDDDAYLLVLLADQELTAGRSDEAAALLDAAYDAFDRCTVDDWAITASG
jgi:hypothetical protein